MMLRSFPRLRGLSLKALCAFVLLAGAPVVAPDIASSTARALSSAEAAAAVSEVNAYINEFKSLQGEFTQIGPTGNVSKGVFIISKPGKMRFEYASPNPYIIVSDGQWVTIKNRAKERGDQYPLSQTPLRLVLAEGVNLAKETKVLAVEKVDGITSITLEDRKRAVPGQLVLVYDESRKALQQWVVIDGKGRRTTVSLENIETGVKADPKLFEIKIDRAKRERNKRN
jgi:outer membrane lipoprotein-sorting protein